VSRRKPPQYDLPRAAPDALRLVQQFLNTSDHEYGNEWIADPPTLSAWLAEHGFAAARVTAGDVSRVQRVREALRALVIGDAPPEARELLEREAERATLRVSFDGDLVPVRGGVDGFLARVFASVRDAMHDGSWSRLKACPNCHWAFWDESKNRSATWCSMELCGNRLKTKRYRSRQAMSRDLVPQGPGP
jgi:predicted RNA-binding Zn ribbon-like protein